MGEVMTVEDEELARIRAARQAEIQNQLQAQAEQQAQMEVEQAAAEQEANVIANAMRTILTRGSRQACACRTWSCRTCFYGQAALVYLHQTIRFKSQLAMIC